MGQCHGETDMNTQQQLHFNALYQQLSITSPYKENAPQPLMLIVVRSDVSPHILIVPLII